MEEKSYFVDEESPKDFISGKLEYALLKQRYDEISVVSALNHFTLMPEGFEDHDSGYDLIAFNAPVDKENTELMLSVNKSLNYSFIILSQRIL